MGHGPRARQRFAGEGVRLGRPHGSSHLARHARMRGEARHSPGPTPNTPTGGGVQHPAGAGKRLIPGAAEAAAAQQRRGEPRQTAERELRQVHEEAERPGCDSQQPSARAGLGPQAGGRASGGTGQAGRHVHWGSMGTTLPPSKRECEEARVAALAARCCMSGALGAVMEDRWLDGTPPVGGADLVATLRAGARGRARETVNLDRAATALEWMVDFVEASRRRPWVELQHAGDLQGAVYNSETLEMLAEFIRRKGSRQRGRLGAPLASDTIDGYISTIKTMRSAEAHYKITLDAVNTVMPAASKRARQLQGAPGERTLKRGIRAAQLKRLAIMGYDRSSAKGMVEWAAALVAHNLLLRGGEVGVVPGAAFDPTRDATFGAVEFKEPCADSAWLPWLTWDVVAIKDANARRRVCPMAIRRRGPGALGADPLCTYDAVVRAWTAQAGSAPPTIGRAQGRLAATPFFIGRRGAAWDTNDTRSLAQRMGGWLGIPPSELGGKSFRIGGATDWRDIFGADAERIIKQRGRWMSDVALLYQRALAETHLRGSAAVGDAASADLESLCWGWAQPATFR